MQRRVAALMLCATVLGCVETGGSNGNSDEIPDVEVQCNVSLCPTNGSATLYVGLTSDLSLDCRDFLSTFTASNPFDQNFEAWGTGTIVLDGGFQTAFITDWYDANDALIGRLTQDTYLMCGFYDTNDNQQLDPLEGYGEDTIDFNSGYVIFDSWSLN